MIYFVLHGLFVTPFTYPNIKIWYLDSWQVMIVFFDPFLIFMNFAINYLTSFKLLYRNKKNAHSIMKWCTPYHLTHFLKNPHGLRVIFTVMWYFSICLEKNTCKNYISSNLPNRSCKHISLSLVKVYEICFHDFFWKWLENIIFTSVFFESYWKSSNN